MALWEQHQKPTKKEIKNCYGDYYGCEVCSWSGLCLTIKLSELQKEIKKINKTKK